jgi:hypothetical protein
LSFSDGELTLRVTDVNARHGHSGSQLEVGGDDVKSGEHALYRFSGRAISSDNQRERCAIERPKHEHARTDAR